MKKLSLLILLTMILAACTDEPVEETKPVTTDEDTIEDSTVNEKTQEELNAELKELAVVIDMDAVLNEEIDDRTLVKSTGVISTIDDSGIRGGDFILTFEGDEDYGIYNIMNLNTKEIELSVGQTVTVYGSYNGLDDAGIPQITATIIE